MHAKEIIKNKADKMVDLIIDEIGSEGDKTLTTSFIDKQSRVKYLMELKIKSGAPESFIPQEEENILEQILERLTALEEKEDQDTIYDDSGIKARLTVLENKTDNDTIYDDTSILERITALEAKINNDSP